MCSAALSVLLNTCMMCSQIPLSGGLSAGTRKALRLSNKYKDYSAEGGPASYLAATAKWAHMLRSGERPSHKSKCKRVQAAQEGAATKPAGGAGDTWYAAAVGADAHIEAAK